MLRCKCNLNHKLDQRGFTLIELVIIIIVLGILAAVAVPKFSDISESSKIAATKSEMINLKKAIVGNPELVSGGVYVNRGFEGDCGIVPSQLSDLISKPDSISVYNKLTRLGWNGPYIENNAGEYALDSWGSNYVYQPSSRRIISIGGTDSIIVSY